MLQIIGTIFGFYCLFYILSIRLRDNSLVDILWWLWFVIITIISFFSSPQWMYQYILSGLVIIWGFRLSSHILLRKIQEKKEDPRYALWRENWGNGWYFFIRSFFQVYILQMLLMFLVALPILVVNLTTFPWTFSNIWLIIGSILAFIGLWIELISDRQLAWFRKIKQPGWLMTTGLYRYSRHPNYFWESLFWLGIGVISIPFSYFGLIGWVTITFLLLFISWIPLQEKRYSGRKEWEEYKSKTSIFIPWFPKG